MKKKKKKKKEEEKLAFDFETSSVAIVINMAYQNWNQLRPKSKPPPLPLSPTEAVFIYMLVIYFSSWGRVVYGDGEGLNLALRRKLFPTTPTTKHTLYHLHTCCVCSVTDTLAQGLYLFLFIHCTASSASHGSVNLDQVWDVMTNIIVQCLLTKL